MAGDAEHLLPVLEATRPRDVFDDPVADGAARPRPVLLVLDDGTDDPVVRSTAAGSRPPPASAGVRVETVSTDASTEVARYASLLLTGSYAAAVPPPGSHLRLRRLLRRPGGVG